MIAKRPLHHIWLTFALLSTICAVVRYFDLSATAYTISYGALTCVGLGAAIYLTLQIRRSVRIQSDLFIATLAPSFLLFIDLSSNWRVFCLLAITLVATLEWRRQRVARDIA
jgi:hypothetical protein